MSRDTSAAVEAVALWDLPTVNGRSVQGRRPGKTVSELEEVERRAYEEAFAKGREAGLAAAKAETQGALTQLQSQVQRLEATLASLSKPLDQVNTEVEQQLMNLTLTIARHLVRRELRIDPAQVIAIIRETVALLPAAARDVRVHMHPDDAAVVRERLATPTADRAWTIIEDPVMTRGGCRVTTETALIDARVETRLNQAIAAMLGDERVDAARGSEEAT
ncbi:MAG TPA: flagellar assembly protein FliH [Steroidobacteraceae bacterium]|nr:flagellar assembly protein FliH [Steroidobacteraceae bacterium]